MVDELIKLRNALEHKFEKPPKYSRCLEYAEMVWYLLKSTDYYARQVSNGAYYVDINNDHYTFGYRGTPNNNWKNGVDGFLPSKMVSKEPKKNTLK